MVRLVKADREPRSRITGERDEENDGQMDEPLEPSPVRDRVDDANKDSFPASDPASWWAGHDAPARRGGLGASGPRPR